MDCAALLHSSIVGMWYPLAHGHCITDGAPSEANVPHVEVVQYPPQRLSFWVATQSAPTTNCPNIALASVPVGAVVDQLAMEVTSSFLPHWKYDPRV